MFQKDQQLFAVKSYPSLKHLRQFAWWVQKQRRGKVPSALFEFYQLVFRQRLQGLGGCDRNVITPTNDNVSNKASTFIISNTRGPWIQWSPCCVHDICAGTVCIVQLYLIEWPWWYHLLQKSSNDNPWTKNLGSEVKVAGDGEGGGGKPLTSKDAPHFDISERRLELVRDSVSSSFSYTTPGRSPRSDIRRVPRTNWFLLYCLSLG